MDKTPAAGRYLISNIAENSQQFIIKGSTIRGVHELEVNAIQGQNLLTEDNTKIGSKTLELITMMRQMALNQQVNGVVKHCGLCAAGDHFTDQRPQLQDVANLEAQIVAGIFQNQQGNQQQGKPRWIPNPNYIPADSSLPHAQYFQNTIAVPKLTPNTQLLRAIQGPTNQHQQYRPQGYVAQHQNSRIGPSVEATILDLKTQIGQLASTVNELVQQRSSALPAQPLVNPKSGKN